MTTDKAKYREWCAKEQGIPVFSQNWWLDAVCGDANWDVILIEKNGAIAASMPFYMKKRGPFSLLTMPPLTQTLGPYITYREGLSHMDKLSHEKKIIGEMIRRLPRFDHCLIKCSYRLTNWLPFHWAGFNQQTAYTYVIPDLQNLERVFSNFDYSKKKDIKKAKKLVEIGFDLTPREFYENHTLTLGKQQSAIIYSFELFKRIYEAAYARNTGRVIYAKDRYGNLHAALFAIWGPEGAYDLISTIDPDYRISGAASLLVQEIIRYVSTFTNRFDFEGSMIEGVEASFRKFGSVQTPYLIITKTPSRLLRLREAIISLLKSK